ncbi:PEP-CTERM sorting domain-containing protein [Cerasicoccus frondis]|uniref:PEP-CTERM sorting domain-containing protein n=1 Tax=Cerasicoccus frondis TaxID=490090 RepID=UPI00285277E6|nr:PEP-CTERM sorting domain-containing protein [Cerasicoccus frondis]
MKTLHLISALLLLCFKTYADHETDFYIIEYDSNLYMTVYGQQETAQHYFGAINIGNFEKKSVTVDASSLATYINPSAGEVAFFASNVISDDVTAERYATTAAEGLARANGQDTNNFGTGGTISFDSGSTYTGSASHFYAYLPYHDSSNSTVSVYVESDYSESDTLAFFSKATGYTLDDVGITSGYEDYYEELTVEYADDASVSFSGYHLRWSVDSDTLIGETQIYNFYLAKTSSGSLVEDIARASGEFSDTQLNEIIELIYSTDDSSGGDDLIEIPNVPEPSTYALLAATLTLGATLLYRRRK